MLSARAYSMRQKGRLAVSLSWIGGYTNVVALLATGALVSHVTGTATQLGRSIGAGDILHLMFFASLLGSFTIGAILSAIMTEGARRWSWRSKYILPVAAEAALLGLLAFWLNIYPPTAGALPYGFACIACLAMGLQNATITKISGAVVRTTHVSGIFTDLGLEGVQFLFWIKDNLVKGKSERAGRLLRVSRRHPSAQRLMLLASIAASFGLGAVAGAVFYNHWSAAALGIPALFLLVIVYADLHTPIADIRDMDLLNDPELKFDRLLKQLLPREVSLYRFACTRGKIEHRAPSFEAWVDRIPERCKIVILAISPLTRFTANAVLDMEAAVQKLHTDGRRLIVCGITPAQYAALDRLGVARMMDTHNLCPDLEFAVARVVTMLEESRPGISNDPSPIQPLAA